MPDREERKLILPNLILCEGPEDAAFFEKLIMVHHLTPWHIRHTGKNRHDRGGNSRFGERLRALRTGRTGFRENIQKLVIASDADEDPGRSFTAIQNQLRAAGISVPDAPRVVSGQNPAVAILMIPSNGRGNLECICQEAARRAARHTAGLVDKFVADVTGGQWTEPQTGKLWLRAMISASWQRDPTINLAPLLSQPGADVIPLIDPSFNDIRDFLANLGS